MIPIYEQGKGEGIGYSVDDFLTSFVAICEEHKRDQRARAFAFILYDFENDAIRKVLKLQGGFARLDRLSGHDLSIFYLHGANPNVFRAFNEVFMAAFDLSQAYSLPLILFFKLRDGEVEDVEVFPLKQENIAFAFGEVFSIVENYVKSINSSQSVTVKKNKAWMAIKKVGKIAGGKTLEIVISKAMEAIGKGVW